jgi:thiamine phosphate synthase YjbQ (UPF0047 family)
MQQTIQIPTPAHNGLYDITRQVESIVAESGVRPAWSMSLFRVLQQV